MNKYAPPVLIAATIMALGGCNPAPAPDLTLNWAADAVWYQIFPERFRNGDPGNDPTSALDAPQPIPGWQVHPWGADFYRRQPWEETVKPDDFYWMHLFRRYGGDLQGIIDKLDYLAGLGINALYLNPIFNADSHHKYDASTHIHIDYHFGPDPQGDRALVAQANETGDPATWVWTQADRLFLELLQQAHARGMRVITDGVFNHVGRSHFAFQDVLKNQQDSPYADWFEIIRWDDPATAEDEFEYSGWWGHLSLPEFNEEDGTVVDGPRQYIFNATARWMDPDGDGDPSDGIDGWRLDTVPDMGVRWWREWHAFVRSVNPQVFTIAEIWYTGPDMVAGDLFTTTMNYPFAMAVIDFVANRNEKPLPSEFDRRLAETRSAYGHDISLRLQNLIDSHDTDRLASMIINPDREYNREARTDQGAGTYDIRKPNAGELQRMKLAVALQMTYLGAPMIYYGDEVGMWGENDPGCRKPMLWDDIAYEDESGHPQGLERQPDSVAPNGDMLEFYRSAIGLRHANVALRRGQYRTILTDDDRELLAFERWTGDQKITVVVNNADRAGPVSLAGMGSWKQLFVAGSAERTGAGTYRLGARSLAVFEVPR